MGPRLHCATPECVWIPRLVVYISIIGFTGLLIAAVITYGVH